MHRLTALLQGSYSHFARKKSKKKRKFVKKKHFFGKKKHFGCNFCWYYEGYSGFSWLVLLFLGICDLPTLVRMAHALSRTGLRKNVFRWTVLLFTSVYSVLLIDSFTSVDNIDYNITFTSPSAFVPTLMFMMPLKYFDWSPEHNKPVVYCSQWNHVW